MESSQLFLELAQRFTEELKWYSGGGILGMDKERFLG